jgi:hypothetical protein
MYKVFARFLVGRAENGNGIIVQSECFSCYIFEVCVRL